MKVKTVTFPEGSHISTSYLRRIKFWEKNTQTKIDFDDIVPGEYEMLIYSSNSTLRTVNFIHEESDTIMLVEFRSLGMFARFGYYNELFTSITVKFE